jgi:hypothetical protein
MTFVTALTDAEQQVARWLPYPVAAAWHEVLVARGIVHLEQRITTAIEVTARLLGVLAICDYLRGPPVPEVETLLQRLERPQPEDWLAILPACARALQLRTEPKPFASELVRWTVLPDRGDGRPQPGPGLVALQKAVDLRGQRLRATMTEVAYDEAAQIEALGHALLATLVSLRWLGMYRLARVTELTTLRHAGFTGRVQLFAGGTADPEPIEAAWTAHLLADVVYVLNGKGTEALEVSPFLRVLPHPKTRRPVCFLFESAPGLRRLQLASDTGNVMVETAIAGPDGEMALAQWLQVRGEHGAWLPNQDLREVLAVDARVGVALQRPPSEVRAIPDLAVTAFRTMPARAHPSTALYLGPQRKRMVLIAQVVAVVALSVVSVKLLGSRARRHGATVAADAPASVVGPRRQAVETQASPKPASAPAAKASIPLQVASAPDAKASFPLQLASASAAKASLPLQVASAPAAKANPPLQVASAPAAKANPPPEVAPAPAAKANPPPEVASAPAAKANPPPQPAPVVAAPAPVMPKPVVARPAPQPGIAAGTPDFVQRGKDLLSVRPAYAMLQFAQAEEAQAGVATELLARTGLKPPGDAAALTARLYQEATAIIYGPRHTPAEKRRMAKDLYGDAARRGLARGYLGLAKIHLLGETNAAACRADLQAYGQAGGAETAEVKGLRGKCER